MSSTATLDPAEAIATAIRELYAQLRELVDRGPTDDPTLLDELAKLTRPIRGRINRALKRAQANEEPQRTTAPAAPVAPSPTVTATTTAPVVVEPKQATATSTSTVPAAITTRPAGERVSIKLAERPQSTAPAVHPIPSAAPASAPRRGRHRINKRRRLLMPILLIAAVLGLVAVMLLACTVETNAAQDTPRTPVPVSIRPDVVLTTPMQPLDIDDAGRHAAFPSLAARPGGDIVLAWRRGSDHVDARDGEIVTATSTNLGGSYDDPVTVLADDDEDYRDPSLSTINGETWMTYFTGSAGLAAEGAFVARGDRAPVRIDSLAYAAIAAPAVALPDGTVGTVYYGRAAGEGRDSVWFARSTNGGANWTSKRIADGQVDGRDYQEPWLAVRNGVVHVLHRYGSWDSIGITSSADGGATWTAPRRILGEATGRPTTLVYSSGTMVTIYRHTGTRAAVAAVSRDGGATWRPAGTLLPSPGGPLGMTYAAVAQIVPGVATLVIAGEKPDGSSALYRGWLAEAVR